MLASVYNTILARTIIYCIEKRKYETHRMRFKKKNKLYTYKTIHEHCTYKKKDNNTEYQLGIVIKIYTKIFLALTDILSHF